MLEMRKLCALRRCSYSVGRILIQRLSLGLHSFCNPVHHITETSLREVSSLRGANGEIKIINKTKKNENTAKSRTSKKNITAKDIENYIHITVPAAHIPVIPNKLYNRKRSLTDCLYLIDATVANTIMDKIGTDVMTEGCVIVELLPGLGLLSKKFLQGGATNVQLYEPQLSFRQHLHKLYGDRVKLFSTNVLNIGRIAYQDKMDNGNRIDSLLSFLPKSDWENDPVVKIVGGVPSINFIKYLIFSIALQRGLLSHCRPEFYLMMSPPVYECISATNNGSLVTYRSTSVLIQLFFDYYLLEKLPQEAFLPWIKDLSDPSKHRGNKKLDRNCIYLVKMVPKKNLYETIPQDKVSELWYFVKQHFMTRRNKVINILENWIPNCGVRLILEDYNIYTKFGDLTPQQVLQLFLQFSSWPEYSDCSFVSSLESALLKEDGMTDAFNSELDNVSNEAETDVADIDCEEDAS